MLCSSSMFSCYSVLNSSLVVVILHVLANCCLMTKAKITSFMLRRNHDLKKAESQDERYNSKIGFGEQTYKKS